MGDRVFLHVVSMAFLLSIVGIGLSIWFKPNPILIGVLHSQTGTMAFSEKEVLHATLAAIEDVNANGGVLGRPLKAIVADGASNEKTFAQQANTLLVTHKVPVIFGGWTSASRKAMLPVLAEHDGLLFYPVQYEGIEQSSHVIYTGMPPNQQLYPALTYMTQAFGKKVLIVGSDYIYPRMASAIANPILVGLGAKVCAEIYIPLGSDKMSDLTAAINACQPDYIVNTINGDSNFAFFKALLRVDKRPPIVSLSLSEPEIRQFIVSLGASVTQQHYASWGYFQSLDTVENKEFIKNFQRYIPYSLINNPMKAAWDGVHLWANAVNLSGVLDSATISRNVAGMSYPSATGVISVDLTNRHIWQKSYIGQTQADGSFKVVWQSSGLVAPNIRPIGHSYAVWEKIEDNWYKQWGDQWQAP